MLLNNGRLVPQPTPERHEIRVILRGLLKVKLIKLKQKLLNCALKVDLCSSEIKKKKIK